MTTVTEAQKMSTADLKAELRKMIQLYERKEMIDWDEEDEERVSVEEDIIVLSQEADKRILEKDTS